MAESDQTLLSEVELNSNSALISLLKRIQGDGFEERTYTYSDFTTEDFVYDMVMRFSVKRMDGTADSVLKKHQKAETDGGKVDAEAIVLMFGLNTEAYIVMYPPYGEGGADIQVPDLKKLLENSGITYGIDESVLDKMVREKAYLKMFCAARGIPPENGENGFITDHYPREASISLKENEDGIIDFKNLNWLIKINEGDIICDVTYGTAGTDGVSVKGEPVKATPGKDPKLPAGENVSLTEDKLHLKADIPGQLFFKDEVFMVDKCLNIPGDVGPKTGHIDAIGDVTVAGNVLSGYNIKATGNVTVMGMVEGAEITAGGDVFISNGMAGDGRGSIRAEGTIKCKYIESGNIYAKGSMYFESIINSEVRSDEAIYVTSGKGIVVGGSISAAGDIKIKVLGNDTHLETKVRIALPSDQEAAYTECENQLKELQKKFKFESEGRAEIAKKQNLFKLYEGDKAAMQRLIQSLPQIDTTLNMEEFAADIKAKQAEFEELKEKAEKTAVSRIYAEQVYPNTKIAILKSERTIEGEQTRCRFRKVGVDIEMGSMDEPLEEEKGSEADETK